MKRRAGKRADYDAAMIPERIPAKGESPDAIAIPIHKGSATRKTTNEAKKSFLILAMFALKFNLPQD